MSLAQLSTELLLLITSNLSEVDLLNASLTSRRLYAATEPALYREYHPPCLRRRSLSSFIKSLLKDPRRLHYVHSLRLPAWEILYPQNEENKFEPESQQRAAMAEGKKLYHSMALEWDPQKVLGQDLSRKDYELFSSAAVAAGLVREIVPYAKGGAVALRGLEKSYDCYMSPLYYWYYFSTADLENMPPDEKFCHLLRAGVDDAYVVLLVSLLADLRRLSLGQVSAMRNALPWAGALQRYPRLREFIVMPESYYEPGYYPLSFFIGILTLPTLGLLVAHGCSSWRIDHGESFTRSPFTLASDSLNIRRLVLERCRLTYEDLKLVLGACRGLKTFQYSTRERREGIPTSLQIIDLLAPFQTTLEELFLNKNSDAYYQGSHPADRFGDQCFHSLEQFTRLERLWTPTNMWANLPGAWEEHRDAMLTSTFAGLLPPCLKEFRLFDSHAYPVLTRPVLGSLLEVASFELPALRTIEVVSRHDHSKKDLNMLEEERQILRDSGTTFTYRFRWSHFYAFALPKTAEELEPHRTHEKRPTCWGGDRYVSKSWASLQAPNILSEKEAEEQRAREAEAILASVEDAPTCNDEIWELHEQGLEEAATGWQYVRDA